MSYSNDDLEQRLRELEIEAQATPVQPRPASAEPPVAYQSSGEVSGQGDRSLLDQVLNWFDSLPTVGKIAVGLGAAFVGLSVLRLFFQLLTALIGLAFLSLVVYVLYRVFVVSDSNSSR